VGAPACRRPAGSGQAGGAHELSGPRQARMVSPDRRRRGDVRRGVHQSLTTVDCPPRPQAASAELLQQRIAGTAALCVPRAEPPCRFATVRRTGCPTTEGTGRVTTTKTYGYDTTGTTSSDKRGTNTRDRASPHCAVHSGLDAAHQDAVRRPSVDETWSQTLNAPSTRFQGHRRSSGAGSAGPS